MPFSARTGCVLTILLAALVLCLGLAFFQVVFRGGLTLRTSQLREIRIWLVQNDGSEGFGISRPHRVSGSERGGEICLRTKVDFMLWSGPESGMDTAYCECFQRAGSTWYSIGACPK